MFELTSSGSWENTEKFLRRIASGEIFASLDQYGQEGVSALRAATPIDSGVTADSWGYEVILTSTSASIVWINTQDVGRPLVILLQYGHGTGTGGYVQGRDFINPAIKPVFDRIEQAVWKAVTAA